MLLISPRMHRTMVLVLKFGYLMKVIPFVWTEKTLQLSLTPSKSGLLAWYCVSIFFQFYQCFLFVRLWQSITESNHSLTYYVLQSVIVTGFLVVTLIQFTYLLRRDQLMSFYNQYISYVIQFDRKFMVLYLILYSIL